MLGQFVIPEPLLKILATGSDGTPIKVLFPEEMVIKQKGSVDITQLGGFKAM